MSKKEINPFIEQILIEVNKSGKKTNTRDVKRIKNFFREDLAMCDRGSLTIDFLDYLKALDFTDEEIDQIFPGMKSNNPVSMTINNVSAEDALQIVTSAYNALISAGYFVTPQKQNIYNIEKLRSFIKNYWMGEIKLNQITQKLEFIGIPELENQTDKTNYLASISFSFLAAIYSHVTFDRVYNDVKSLANNEFYNPVVKMLEAEKWDGQDRLPIVYKYLQQTGEFEKTLIRKWLIQCVAMLFNDGTLQAEGCLTLCGPQGVGKTAFFQNIVPEPTWFRSIDAFDPKDKDKVIKATSIWIGELSEVEDMYKKDQGALKSFITERVDSYRAAYAREQVERVRISSFGATVNKTDFLSDEGARRWWIINVNNYNTPEMMKELKENSKQIWAQVYQIYLADKTGYRLQAEERNKVIVNNNTNYAKALPFEEELYHCYNFEKRGSLKSFPEIRARVASLSGNENMPNSEARLLSKTLKILIKRHNVTETTLHGYSAFYLFDINNDTDTSFEAAKELVTKKAKNDDDNEKDPFEVDEE